MSKQLSHWLLSNDDQRLPSAINAINVRDTTRYQCHGHELSMLWIFLFNIWFLARSGENVYSLWEFASNVMQPNDISYICHNTGDCDMSFCMITRLNYQSYPCAMTIMIYALDFTAWRILKYNSCCELNVLWLQNSLEKPMLSKYPFIRKTTMSPQRLWRNQTELRHLINPMYYWVWEGQNKDMPQALAMIRFLFVLLS